MLEKWKKYTAVEVQTGKDLNGNRLISSFARDYKSIFNQEICPSCKDFSDKFQKFLKKIESMEENKKNSVFLLKKMYENIPLKFGSGIFVNNKNITDEYATHLIKTHPRGRMLFDFIPKDFENNDLSDVEKLKKEKTGAELIEMAENLGIKNPKGSKNELASLIVAKQSEKSGDDLNQNFDNKQEE